MIGPARMMRKRCRLVAPRKLRSSMALVRRDRGVVVGSGAVRADDWRFSRANDVFDRHAALVGAAGGAARAAPGQFAGHPRPVGRRRGTIRSVDVSDPDEATRAKRRSGQPASTAYQPAPTSPAYGSDPEFGPPPLGADVNGGNLTGRGVLDELRPVGNDPYWADPTRFIPLFPNLQESQTGRLMFGVGVNSDQGVMGSIILDEQNFDWTRFPRSLEEIRNATAWRGAGQHLRIEAVPGTEVQRYMINFQEPYLDVLGYESSLGLSGFYYTRNYTEWDENRVGGRVALGYHFTHALTGSLAFRGMKVGIFDLIDPAPQELLDALGNSALYGFQLQPRPRYPRQQLPGHRGPRDRSLRSSRSSAPGATRGSKSTPENTSSCTSGPTAPDGTC